MKEPLPEVLVDRNGREVRVKKIAAKGKRGRLIKPTPGLNSMSPFERFSQFDGKRFQSY